MSVILRFIIVSFSIILLALFIWFFSLFAIAAIILFSVLALIFKIKPILKRNINQNQDFHCKKSNKESGKILDHDEFIK